MEVARAAAATAAAAAASCHLLWILLLLRLPFSVALFVGSPHSIIRFNKVIRSVMLRLTHNNFGSPLILLIKSAANNQSCK